MDIQNTVALPATITDSDGTFVSLQSAYGCLQATGVTYESENGILRWWIDGTRHEAFPAFWRRCLLSAHPYYNVKALPPSADNPFRLLDALAEAEPGTLIWQDLFAALTRHVGSPARTAGLVTAKTRGEPFPRLATIGHRDFQHCVREASRCPIASALAAGDLFTTPDGRRFLCVFNGLSGVFTEPFQRAGFLTRFGKDLLVIVTGHLDVPPFDVDARDADRRRLLARIQLRAVQVDDGDCEEWTPDKHDNDLTQYPFRLL